MKIPYVLYVSVSSSSLVSSNRFYFSENGKSNKQRLPLPPPPPVSIPYETSYLDDGANEEENAETDIFGEEQGLCHLIQK